MKKLLSKLFLLCGLSLLLAGTALADEVTYVAQLDGENYTSIEAAIGACDTSDTKYIVLLTDTTLTGNLTIPAGVTLFVPYCDDYTNEHETNDTTSALRRFSYESDLYVTLTVPEDYTLTVNGTLVVGGVMSCKTNGGYQGHTTGAYGQIQNEGNIIVNDGGTLDIWGFVKGEGTVTAYSGADVYEPFIVVDFSGGTNTSAYYMDYQSPFKQYTMENIQNTLVLYSGSTLYGHCNLYASLSYNETDAPVISSGDSLFHMYDGTVITRTYTYDEAVATALNLPDLGMCHYKVTGGLDFQSLSMTIMSFLDVSTDDVDFPMPYNYSFTLNDGTYTISNGIKILPGMEMVVAEDATLTVLGDSYAVGSYTYYPRLYVMDGLTQSYMSGDLYPTGEQLKAAGLSQSGMLLVDGTFEVVADGIFAGLVQSNGDTGKIILADDAVLSVTDLQTGAKSGYDDCTSFVDLSAKICTRSGLIFDLEAGNTYVATGDDSFVLEGYKTKYMTETTESVYNDYLSYIDTVGVLATSDIGYVSMSSSTIYHILVEETVTINQAMTGQWKNENAGDTEANFLHQTYYDSTDDSRTTVSYTLTDNVLTFTISLTDDGENYVYLPTCTVNGVETELNQATDGSYYLNAEGIVVVTITSVRLGDVNLSDAVNSSDALEILKYATSQSGLTELQLLAADVNDSGSINSSDALLVLNFATSGTYEN